MAERPTILVVEDDAMSRSMMERLLEREGLHAELAEDGPACLARMEREPLPDLVLLDVSMPGMSGLEVLAWIRSRWEAERLPVLMVTALADGTDVVRGLESGANDYITKPVNPPLLLARVRSGLRLRSGVASLVESERSAHFLDALHRAVSRLEEPLADLEAAHRTLAEARDALSADATAALDAARGDAARLTDVVARFRALADLRTAPHHEGLAALVDATLERLGRA